MQIDPSTLIWTIINFLLLMVLLNRFLFKPLTKFMQERQRRIDAGLQAGRESAARLEDTQKAFLEQQQAQRITAQRQTEDALRGARDMNRRQREEHDTALRGQREAALAILREEQEQITQELYGDIPRMIDQLNDRINSQSAAGS